MANCWPVIRNARLVSRALERKGMVTFGVYWDEEAGYELLLTEAGLRAAGELAELDA